VATILVFRPLTRHRDRWRKYQLLVDGDLLATIAHGETVRPGAGFAVLDVMRLSKYPVLERVESGQSPE
jgi:hypothetical protein